MDNEQALRNIAVIQARVACVLISLEGMKAANLMRKQHGLPPAYDDAAFEKLIEDEGIHHKAAMKELYT